MSRRARAIAFAFLALVCAGIAAALAGGAGGGVAAQLGKLRPVVVARADLDARRPLTPKLVERSLEVRRVPERFVPAGALATPQQALGHAPIAPIPAGAYLLQSHLRLPGPRRPPRPSGLAPGHEPVEITVTGAEALAVVGGDPTGLRVDVVVTTEPTAGGADGRTHVAARAVELIGLREAGGGAVPVAPGADAWIATLALERHQALRLIQAENYAREVRLIPWSHGRR